MSRQFSEEVLGVVVNSGPIGSPYSTGLRHLSEDQNQDDTFEDESDADYETPVAGSAVFDLRRALSEKDMKAFRAIGFINKIQQASDSSCINNNGVSRSKSLPHNAGENSLISHRGLNSANNIIRSQDDDYQSNHSNENIANDSDKVRLQQNFAHISKKYDINKFTSKDLNKRVLDVTDSPSTIHEPTSSDDDDGNIKLPQPFNKIERSYSFLSPNNVSGNDQKNLDAKRIPQPSSQNPQVAQKFMRHSPVCKFHELTSSDDEGSLSNLSLKSGV